MSGELECIICGGNVVQDYIVQSSGQHRGVGPGFKVHTWKVEAGCHCTACGIKYGPNLKELSGLFEARQQKLKGG